MRHCTVAPLSAAVTVSIVTLVRFGPGEESEDLILTLVAVLFCRNCPKAFVIPGTPGSAVIVQTSSPVPVTFPQEKVKFSPEQVCSLTSCRVTERERMQYRCYIVQ